jgi:hypothetical protein
MGSGVVIERNRITTNAYLSWQVHCRPWQVWHNSVLAESSSAKSNDDGERTE